MNLDSTDREPSEIEREMLALTQQYEDDLGLVVETRVEWQGGEEVLLTDTVTPIDGVQEWHRPPVRHGSVDAWREWIEAEYAPSFY